MLKEIVHCMISGGIVGYCLGNMTWSLVNYWISSAYVTAVFLLWELFYLESIVQLFSLSSPVFFFILEFPWLQSLFKFNFIFVQFIVFKFWLRSQPCWWALELSETRVQGSTWVNLVQLYLLIIDMLKLEEGLGLTIPITATS